MSKSVEQCALAFATPAIFSSGSGYRSQLRPHVHAQRSECGLAPNHSRRRRSRFAHKITTIASTAAPPPAQTMKPETNSVPDVTSHTQSPKRVLVLHTGGTLGMEPEMSFEDDGDLVPGSGGVYPPTLAPGRFLDDLLDHVPELSQLDADLSVKVVLNCDSCRVTPKDWVTIAKNLDKERDSYEGFVVVTGTDTMVYIASALSFLLVGFNKPIIVTGSQRPLTMARTDARQNLVDSVSVAVSGVDTLFEVCICFGGLLLRGNRAQKSHSFAYRAFSSPTYPELAKLGVDVKFDHSVLLPPSEYCPRFDLKASVMRIPVVPGLDPYMAYGSVAERGVEGVVLEVFGVGNCDDRESAGWIPWLRDMRAAGVAFFLTSQCEQGYLSPQRYRSGSAAIMLGAASSSPMTPEAATVKLMIALADDSVILNEPIAGEV